MGNTLTITNLEINGCWSFEPKIHSDSRGDFYEWFQADVFNEIQGEEFQLAQANCSTSKKGVLRGIHYTKSAPGQSKLVTVISGSVLDVIVDLRQSSPTFKKWQIIKLEAANPKSIYIPWGVGHGFLSLEDYTNFVYLCDQRYNPANEFDLNAFDPDIGIEWPSGIKVIQSDKDKSAPPIESINDQLPQ